VSSLNLVVWRSTQDRVRRHRLADTRTLARARSGLLRGSCPAEPLIQRLRTALPVRAGFEGREQALRTFPGERHETHTARLSTLRSKENGSWRSGRHGRSWPRATGSSHGSGVLVAQETSVGAGRHGGHLGAAVPVVTELMWTIRCMP